MFFRQGGFDFVLRLKWLEVVLVSMRKQFLLFLLYFLFSRLALAQNNEVGLTLGGLLPQDRGSAPNNISLSRGTSYEANYGRRLISGRTAVYGELNFLANPQRVVRSANAAATRDVATLYVTPGVRVKCAAGSAVSPYVALGGGAAWYQQSFFRINGGPNRAPRNLYRGGARFRRRR
jgi:hypothetical protein